MKKVYFLCILCMSSSLTVAPSTSGVLDLSKNGFTGQKKIFNFLKGLLDPIQPPVENVLSEFGPIFTTFVSGDGLESLLSTVTSFPTQCLAPIRGYIDEELGDFTTHDNSPYCSSSCFRHIICCAPSRPEEVGLTFMWSNGKDEMYPVEYGDVNFYNEVQSSNKPMVLYIAGIVENISVFPHMHAIRDAYIALGYNVLMVDWSYSKFEPLQSYADIRIVSALIGRMLKWLGNAHQSTCIGASSGAHVCGEAGKWLKKRNVVLAKCIGLDPGGILHDGCSDEVNLDASDCGTVVAIHSSIYRSPLTVFYGGSGIGSPRKIGHCDFWLNDPGLQPKCINATAVDFARNLLTGRFGQMDYDLEFLIVCSHARAIFTFQSQAQGVCNFTGSRVHMCDGQQCNPSSESRSPSTDDPAPAFMAYPPFDTCTSDMNADYRITTTGVEPFC